MADVPFSPQSFPYAVEVKAGQRYWWCACGQSNKQPFCDGSHAGSSFSPVEYVATQSTLVYFCGCKLSEGKPLCDGSHSQLS